MLKFFIVFIILTLFITVLKLKFFSNTTHQTQKRIFYPTKETNQSIEENRSTFNEIPSSLDESLISENEIQLLMNQANQLWNDDTYKAIDIYNEIIAKLRNSDDPKLLKIFSQAQFSKAHLLSNYLQNNEETIEVYNEVIEQFENSSNPELLKIFASAQFTKAYFFDSEEAVEIYNEIIDKFKDSSDVDLLKQFTDAQFFKATLLENNLNNKEGAIAVYDEIIDKFKDKPNNAFSNQLANAMSAKSYLMIDDNGEEAMQIYNDVIDKFKDSKDTMISADVSDAIINNIELALINNVDDFDYRNLAQDYLADNKNTQPLLEMLDILKNAQNSNQDTALENWKNEHKEYQFSNWSFSQLETWANQTTDEATKNRLNTYINEFRNHNNSVPVPYLQNYHYQFD